MSARADVLAIGAHPDDIELTIGGLVLLAKQSGLRVAMAHLTAGEMGTRGTPEQRRREAEQAAAALGADSMEILDLRDGRISVDEASKTVLIRLLRRHRPRLVLAPYFRDLHPDHEAAGQLVRQSSFLAGLSKWETEQDPWRPEGLLYYMSHTTFEPTLVVDITAQFEHKKQAAAFYGSQFFREQSKEPATFISSAGFWQWWEGRARHYGSMIGVDYGEPYWSEGPLPFRNPFQLFHGFGKYRNS